MKFSHPLTVGLEACIGLSSLGNRNRTSFSSARHLRAKSFSLTKRVGPPAGDISITLLKVTLCTKPRSYPKVVSAHRSACPGQGTVREGIAGHAAQLKALVRHLQDLAKTKKRPTVQDRRFFPHISVWGSSFVGCHPARLRPCLPPSLRPSVTHTIILSSDLFPSHTIISSSHTHTLILSSHISHSHTQSSHHLTHTLISSCHLTSFSHFSHCLSCLSFSFILFHLHLIYSPFLSSHSHTHNHLVALIHSQLHLFALLVTSHTRSGRRSLQRLQKGLRRALSPLGARLGPALSAVAGAVSRDCRRGCGARCRRWGPGSLRSETAEGAAARVVAAGGPALSAVAGAVSRDCSRGCGARCRRWGPGSLRSLCATAIVISTARVLTGSESHCNGCGTEVGRVCLCATAIVICTARAINACESHCKCCGEGVGEACRCATAIVICSSLV